MPQVRTWFAGETVTQCNSWALLYFDPGRTRLMLQDGFFDFSNLRDRAYAMAWCKTNGVGFFDHRPALLPLELRERIRRARAAGVGELRELKSRWRLISLPGAELFIPQLSDVPSWREARRERPPPPKQYPPPRFWNRTQHHAHTCACYDCSMAREAGSKS